MDEFFLRFILQKMIGVFDDDAFKYECVMEASKDEIESFISECKMWQIEQAEKLKEKFDLTSLNNKKILYIGDSITVDRFGYRGITTFAAGLDSYNGAVSGATSVDMLRFLSDNIRKSNPEIISVMVGTNDSLTICDKKNLVSVPEYRNNISEILRISKQHTDKIIISTLPPVNEKAYACTHDTQISKMTLSSVEALCDAVREEANIHNVYINDAYKALKDKDFDKIVEMDGVHLTKDGQVLFAEQWIKSVLAMYNQVKE